MMADSNAKKRAPHTSAQKAFQRKVKRDSYLSSGFDDETEKTRMIEIFDSVVWPKLVLLGWEKVEDESRFRFDSADKTASFDRIFDLFAYIMRAKNDDSLGKIASEIIAASHTSDEDEAVVYRHSLQVNPPSHHQKLAKNKPQLMTSPSSVEMSWKNGGREFPKRSSQVGPQHQATKLPKPGSFKEKRNLKSDSYAELAWSPSQAAEKGLSLETVDALMAGTPCQVKEPALVLFAEVGYNVEAFQKASRALKPTDGSDWNAAQKSLFHSEIFRLRKDIIAVAKVMRIPIMTAYTFYLSHFKFSDDYRILKAILMNEHDQRTEMQENEQDECAICGDGGNLLICDGCEGEYHVECLRPALKRVPEGNWECDTCVDKQFLATREALIRNTMMFKPIINAKRELGSDEEAQKDSAKKQKTHHEVYEPVDDVRIAVRTMALAISEAFAGRTKPAEAADFRSTEC